MGSCRSQSELANPYWMGFISDREPYMDAYMTYNPHVRSTKKLKLSFHLDDFGRTKEQLTPR